MYERFKLVVVKLVCIDVNATDFTRYSFKKNYLAIKDLEDEEQPYGIIYNKYADMVKIFTEMKESNKMGKLTTGLCFREEYDDVVWEFKDDYKFKEVE